MEILTIKGGGGVRPLMEKTILNFHFDYLNPRFILSENQAFANFATHFASVIKYTQPFTNNWTASYDISYKTF